MSVTALVTGRLIADPQRRTGPSGKPFTLARLVATTEDAETIVSVIAFGSTGDKLGAMTKGDTVALVGRAKVNTWADREGKPASGLSVTADQLLTAYHLKRKRQAVAAARQVEPGQVPDADPSTEPPPWETDDDGWLPGGPA